MIHCTSVFGEIKSTKTWILMKIFIDRCEEYQIPNYIYVKNELENIKESVDMEMYGNEGVLTYINKTSRGQSGGPAIRKFFNNYYQSEIKQLVGVHVSGYLQRSKCTFFVQSNLNWIKSHHDID